MWRVTRREEESIKANIREDTQVVGILKAITNKEETNRSRYVYIGGHTYNQSDSGNPEIVEEVMEDSDGGGDKIRTYARAGWSTLTSEVNDVPKDLYSAVDWHADDENDDNGSEWCNV